MQIIFVYLRINTNMSVLKSKKSLKKAPKVAPPKPINGNYMKEADTKLRLKSRQWPMKQKRLSK